PWHRGQASPTVARTAGSRIRRQRPRASEWRAIAQ
ncbi:conserved hypothetical protein, partial [Stigmatella aurantiaca DW4/3-1]